MPETKIWDADSSSWLSLHAVGPTGSTGATGADSTVTGPTGPAVEVFYQPEAPVSSKEGDIWIDSDSPGLAGPTGHSITVYEQNAEPIGAVVGDIWLWIPE